MGHYVPMHYSSNKKKPCVLHCPNLYGGGSLNILDLKFGGIIVGQITTNTKSFNLILYEDSDTSVIPFPRIVIDGKMTTMQPSRGATPNDVWLCAGPANS